MEKTWEISDIDGGNKRTVTLAEFLAAHRAQAERAKAIFAADAKRAGLDPSRILGR